MDSQLQDPNPDTNALKPMFSTPETLKTTCKFKASFYEDQGKFITKRIKSKLTSKLAIVLISFVNKYSYIILK